MHIRESKRAGKGVNARRGTSVMRSARSLGVTGRVVKWKRPARPLQTAAANAARVEKARQRAAKAYINRRKQFALAFTPAVPTLAVVEEYQPDTDGMASPAIDASSASEAASPPRAHKRRAPVAEAATPPPLPSADTPVSAYSSHSLAEWVVSLSSESKALRATVRALTKELAERPVHYITHRPAHHAARKPPPDILTHALAYECACDASDPMFTGVSIPPYDEPAEKETCAMSDILGMLDA